MFFSFCLLFMATLTVISNDFKIKCNCVRGEKYGADITNSQSQKKFGVFLFLKLIIVSSASLLCSVFICFFLVLYFIISFVFWCEYSYILFADNHSVISVINFERALPINELKETAPPLCALWPGAVLQAEVLHLLMCSSLRCNFTAPKHLKLPALGKLLEILEAFYRLY